MNTNKPPNQGRRNRNNRNNNSPNYSNGNGGGLRFSKAQKDQLSSLIQQAIGVQPIAKNGNWGGMRIGADTMSMVGSGTPFAFNAVNVRQQTQFTDLSYFETKAPSTKSGLRVEGREMILPIKTKADYGGGFYASYQTAYPDMSPRLVKLGAIYEYYKFHQLTVMFQPILQNYNGMIALAFDTDYEDAVPADMISLCRNSTAATASVTMPCSSTMSGKSCAFDRYFVKTGTSTSSTNKYQANVIYGYEGVVPSTNVTATKELTLGYLIISYDCEFFTPE